jgi:hypothetical protein
MSKVEFCAPIPHSVLTLGNISVPNNSIAYSESWVLTRKNFFGVEVQFSSDTDVNVQVDLEQSNYKPSVQGSYSPDFVTAIDTLATITNENVHLLPIAPVVAVYARFKLTGLETGLASNSATTVLTRANWVEVEA